MSQLRRAGVLVLGALVAACGGSSGHGPSAAAQVKTNWQAFWSAKTTTPQKVRLLQNGTRFESVIAAAEKNPLATQLSSKVTKVSVSGDTATVTWTVSLGSQTLNPGLGQAVRVSGKWLVSDATFCMLAQLETGRAPDGCP